MANEFSINLRVYIEDTDVGGVVYHVNYLKYMERARTEYLRALGSAKAAVLANGSLFVVVSVNLNYKRPACLDDELVVTAKVIQQARTYLVFEQTVLLDGVNICEGQVKIACVNADSFRPTVIPSDIAAAIKN